MARTKKINQAEVIDNPVVEIDETMLEMAKQLKEGIENVNKINDDTITEVVILSPLAVAQMEAEEKLATVNQSLSFDDREKLLLELATLNTALANLNTEERASQYSEILATDSPILEACKRGVLTLTVVKQPTKKAPNYSFISSTEIIDILEVARIHAVAHINDTEYQSLLKHANAGLIIESLNRLILAFEVKQGDGILSKKWNNFNMTVEAESIINAKLSDINEGSDFLPLVQTVANALVDGIKLERKDVSYWVGKYATFSKTINGVKASKDSAFRKSLMRLLNKSVTGERWTIE